MTAKTNIYNSYQQLNVEMCSLICLPGTSGA